jgi:hypothetical protein
VSGRERDDEIAVPDSCSAGRNDHATIRSAREFRYVALNLAGVA